MLIFMKGKSYIYTWIWTCVCQSVIYVKLYVLITKSINADSSPWMLKSTQHALSAGIVYAIIVPVSNTKLGNESNFVMEPLPHDKPPVNRLAYVWDLDFATQQHKAYPTQNVPVYANYGNFPQNTADIVRNFMRDDGESCLYQTATLQGFCLYADLNILKAGIDDRVLKPVALLDDRNEEGIRTNERGTTRPQKGSLNAHQLHEQLCKKVGPIPTRYNFMRITLTTVLLGKEIQLSAWPKQFIEACSLSNRARWYKWTRCRSTAAVGPATVHQTSVDSDWETISEFRYVTNLDCWSLLAIITTTPEVQAAYLRDFIYKYLEFKTYMGVRFPVCGTNLA